MLNLEQTLAVALLCLVMYTFVNVKSNLAVYFNKTYKFMIFSLSALSVVFVLQTIASCPPIFGWILGRHYCCFLHLSAGHDSGQISHHSEKQVRANCVVFFYIFCLFIFYVVVTLQTLYTVRVHRILCREFFHCILGTQA